MGRSLEDLAADPLGSALEVMDVCHRQSRDENSVTIHKLGKCVTNWVASTADSAHTYGGVTLAGNLTAYSNL